MKTTLYKIPALVLIFISSLSYSQSESDIVITEIMYNQPGDDSLEYIELYNKGASAVDLTGYTFTSGITFTFPSYTLNANSYVVLSKYPNFVDPFYSITSIGWTEGSLSNSGEKIVLKTPVGTIVDSVEFEDGGPWNYNPGNFPSSDPDGGGPSIVLCNPAMDNSLGYNWVPSDEFVGIIFGEFIFGNPGRGNSSCTAPGDVFPPRIRKAYAETPTKIIIKYDEPVQLSASQNTANFTGLTGVSSAVRSASMDTVVLTLSSPLSIGTFYTLTVSNMADTAGNVTTTPKTETIVFNNTISSLVITEIFYDNNGQDTLEFVEVLNNGISAAIVGGYEFKDGMDFVFPEMTINPGEYVIIVQNPTAFNQFFGTSASLQFIGSLINEGEKLTIKNTVGDVIDSLTYYPVWQPSTNPGASLVLCDPNTPNHIGSNWGASGDYKGDFMGTFPVWASPGEAGTACIPLGIGKKFNKNSLLTVYPNPSSGAFEVISDFSSNSKRIDIMNCLGEIVHSEISLEKKTHLNISAELTRGLYFIKVTDLVNNTSGTVKVLLE